MNDQDFYETLLERAKYWQGEVKKATIALEATNALIAIEKKVDGLEPTQKASLQNIPFTYAPLRSRKAIILKALEAIGHGTTIDVSNKIIEQNKDITFEKAKDMARAELSLLKTRGQIGYKKQEGSLSYTYKFIKK